MKRNVASIVIAFLTLIIAGVPLKGFSQKLPCPFNIDWETGDTTGWIAQYGGPNSGSGSSPGGVTTGPSNPPPPAVPMSIITTPNPGFVAGRQTVVNTSMPNDPYGNFPVVAPNGGQFAVKIGDDNVNNGADRVQFTFSVPPGVNFYSINFLYAVVIQNPTGHDPEEMPRFSVSVKDAATGLSIKDGCYDLNFIAGGDLPGFLDNGSGVQYKPWTKHTLNLSGTAGKTVIVDVATGDCTLGGHFGYGYFDVLDCGEFKTILDSCDLDRGGVYLSAPEGFMTYEWYNSDYSILVDTGQYVDFQPIDTVPRIYKVVLTPYPSVSLCKDTIETIPLANININKIDSTCMLPNTPVVFDANIYGGAGPITYEWMETNPFNSLSCTTCPVPTATTPSSNSYTVKVTDTNKCVRTELMTIGVNENSVDAIDDFVVCRPGYTQLDAEGDGPPPLTPVTCGTDNATACATPNNIIMRTMYRQQFAGKEDTSSVNSPFAAQYTSAHMQFLINKDDMFKSGMRYGTLTSLGFDVADPGTANLSTFKISLACTKQNALGGAFIPNTTPVYTATGAVTPTAGWNDFIFDQPYNWDTAQNLVVDICFHNPITEKPATVWVTNTGAADAIVGLTVAPTGNVCLNGKTDDVVSYVGRPTMRAGFCKSADAPFQYTWYPSIYIQDTTLKAPLVYVNKTFEYFVQTVGGSDCLVKDSVTITVPIHDYDIDPKDTTICYGESYGINALGTAFTSVQWYEYDPINNTYTIPTTLSCNGCADPSQIANPIAKPLDTLIYALVYTDQYNCKDTAYSLANVKPLPPVRILNNDTTIRYGHSIQLLVGGAYLYSWSPLSSLSHPNLANPFAAPTEPTTYYVWGLAEDGCRNLDSVHINIDYRDNLFVPTAFTPNGDGKNDVFRVSNITFQKLHEFRIFNRWGQEIYSTTDPKKGWDGSWKGVPQDMGVYQYLIKVAYPDGYIETYKGDVTLVR